MKDQHCCTLICWYDICAQVQHIDLVTLGTHSGLTEGQNCSGIILTRVPCIFYYFVQWPTNAQSIDNLLYCCYIFRHCCVILRELVV